MNQLRRIGLFGGSFDPVHGEHVRMAELARTKLGLDAVFFIPARHAPHKRTAHPAPARDRAAMLALALRGRPGLYVDLYELRRPGTTYTYQTVRHFARRFPGARLFFIMGSDSFKELHTWVRPDDILARCELIIVERTAVSSTDIRRRLAGGRTTGKRLAPPVAAYIKDHHLYEDHH